MDELRVVVGGFEIVVSGGGRSLQTESPEAEEDISDGKLGWQDDELLFVVLTGGAGVCGVGSQDVLLADELLQIVADSECDGGNQVVSRIWSVTQDMRDGNRVYSLGPGRRCHVGDDARRPCKVSLQMRVCGCSFVCSKKGRGRLNHGKE